MEPLDPKLARLVHEGMVQAVPDQAREDRVLLGLLARLPPSGPPGDGGGDGSDAPVGESLGGPEAGLGGHAARQGLPRAGKGTAGAGKGTAGAGKGTAAAAMGTSTASKVLLVVGLLGAATVGGTMLGRSREPAAPGTVAATSPAATEPAPAPARPVQPAPVTRDPLPAEPPFDASASVEREPSEAEVAGTSARRSTARARATASPRPSAHDRATAPDVLAAEIQQIAAADRALASGDARRALRLAREHATTHPQGQLALEREAIELGARCLLREAGAAAAATAFLAAHAEAPAAAKVRTRCAASISTDDR